MPFENPLVAGEELIRSAIRSKNYIQSSAGWRISREGDAEFENATMRGTLTGELAQFGTVTAGPYNVQTELEARPTKKLLAVMGISAGTENWTGTGPHRYATLQVTLKANRDYLVCYSGIEFSTGVLNDSTSVVYRYEWDGTIPTAASPMLFGGSATFVSRGATGNSYGMGPVGIASSTTDRVFTVGIFFSRNQGTGANLYSWAGNNGLFWIEDVGPMSVRGGTKYTPAAGSSYTPTRYDFSYAMTSARSYNQAGNLTSASNGDLYAFQGDGSAVGNPGGDHCGLFFFDSALIRSHLTGATLISSYVWVDNVHCYLNSGITAKIGTHNSDPEPATFPAGTATQRWNLFMAKGGNAWTGDLGVALGNELKAGTTRGLTLGYGGIGVINNYGYFNNAWIRLIFDK